MRLQLAMRFEVKIENHQRLEQFLNRVNTLRHWNLYNEEQQTLSPQDRSWVVKISYLALLKHIAIGGNWYVDRNFLFLQKNDWQDKEYYKAYNKARSPKYLMNRFRKIISIAFGMRDNINMWSKNFIVNDRFVEKTEQGDLSTKIWQGVASYLASEIDNVFFLLPYDEVKRQISRQVRGNNQQDPFNQNWKWKRRPDLVGFYLHEGVPSPIVIEAKGYSNKPSDTQINNWKIQAASSGIQVPYSVVAATYHLYDPDTSPKCLYKDPETLPGYELTNKDYARLLNVYYQPFKDLVKNFKFLLQEKEIQGVEYYVLNLGKILSEIPYVYNLLKCLDYQYPHLDYHYYRNCFSFISQHNLYLRKDFLYADWTNKIDFSLFKKHYKIQEPNLYIDNDWIWFGIED